MGQTVYVLTTLMDNSEWRPTAVVTDEYTADQWVRSGNNNDWIPFELDDLSTTGGSKGQMTPFKPSPKKQTDPAQAEMNSQLMKANEQHKQLVIDLNERLKNTKP